MRRKALAEACDLGQRRCWRTTRQVLEYLTGRGLTGQRSPRPASATPPRRGALGSMLRAEQRPARTSSTPAGSPPRARSSSPATSSSRTAPTATSCRLPRQALGARSTSPQPVTTPGSTTPTPSQGANDVIIIEGEFDALVLQQHLRQSTDAILRATAVVGVAGCHVPPTWLRVATSRSAARSTSGSTPTTPAHRRAAHQGRCSASKCPHPPPPRGPAQVRLVDYLADRADDRRPRWPHLARRAAHHLGGRRRRSPPLHRPRRLPAVAEDRDRGRRHRHRLPRAGPVDRSAA